MNEMTKADAYYLAQMIMGVILMTTDDFRYFVGAVLYVLSLVGAFMSNKN